MNKITMSLNEIKFEIMNFISCIKKSKYFENKSFSICGMLFVSEK